MQQYWRRRGRKRAGGVGPAVFRPVAAEGPEKQGVETELAVEMLSE